MSFMPRGGGALEYFPCRYGTSRLVFRGPKRVLRKPYAAILGGNETYGRYIPAPYPNLIEAQTGRHMLNLGYPNAGVDVFLNDESVMGLCQNAHITVVQILGAQNLSNRYYTVHPRRNDRFLKASKRLKALFSEVDFTEFNFTRHLLTALETHAPDRFNLVANEIRTAWVSRMRQLLSTIRPKKILLWIADHPPGGPTDFDPQSSDPLFVTRDMLGELKPLVDDIVEVIPSKTAKAGGTKGMVYPEEAHAIATSLPGLTVHKEVAEVLGKALSKSW